MGRYCQSGRCPKPDVFCHAAIYDRFEAIQLDLELHTQFVIPQISIELFSKLVKHGFEFSQFAFQLFDLRL